jgi:hypothetical protein
MTELDEESLSEITGGLLPKTIGGNTGCTGPVQATCGIIVCPIRFETI